MVVVGMAVVGIVVVGIVVVEIAVGTAVGIAGIAGIAVGIAIKIKENIINSLKHPRLKKYFKIYLLVGIAFAVAELVRVEPLGQPF